MAKTDVFKMASVRHLEFKILNLCHRIFDIVIIFFSVQNGIKIS